MAARIGASVPAKSLTLCHISDHIMSDCLPCKIKALEAQVELLKRFANNHRTCSCAACRTVLTAEDRMRLAQICGWLWMLITLLRIAQGWLTANEMRAQEGLPPMALRKKHHADYWFQNLGTFQWELRNRNQHGKAKVIGTIPAEWIGDNQWTPLKVELIIRTFGSFPEKVFMQSLSNDIIGQLSDSVLDVLC
jgi:hypothetical protein